MQARKVAGTGGQTWKGREDEGNMAMLTDANAIPRLPSQEKWRSCRFPPSAKACDFEPGDGVGAGGRGSETYVGHADSEHACIEGVLRLPVAAAAAP